MCYSSSSRSVKKKTTSLIVKGPESTGVVLLYSFEKKNWGNRLSLFSKSQSSVVIPEIDLDCETNFRGPFSHLEGLLLANQFRTRQTI